MDKIYFMRVNICKIVGYDLKTFFFDLKKGGRKL